MSRLKRIAVKEAFDNLPGGVCFFDKNGFVTLCNYQMYRLAFELTGRDLQSLPEFESDLNGVGASKRIGENMYALSNSSVWRFSKESVATNGGDTYTQLTASDVTELYKRQKELERDNQSLREYAERMRRLSADIINLIREEEILNMKMRVHDDIGRSVIATRRLLQQNRPIKELDLTEWKNAVRLLKHDIETADEKDALSGLMKAAEGIGIKFVSTGSLPPQKHAADIIVSAVRECMTNAVRHAGAGELYASFSTGEDTAEAVITNNGAVPQSEIVEGGGLSSLRDRIEKSGGTMTIRSSPEFELRVSVPLRTEESV